MNCWLVLLVTLATTHARDHAFESVKMPPLPNEYPFNVTKDAHPLDDEDMFDFIKRISQNTAARRAINEFKKNSPNTNSGRYLDVVPEFKCAIPKPAPKAKSVHALRPSDIRIVAAIGDSISASFGSEASNLIELFSEYRGVSFSGGGRKTLADHVTLANVLKEYADVTGYATANTIPKIRMSWLEKLDVAVSGDTSYEILAQAKHLVKMLKEKKYRGDNWKVINLFIGGNDLCACCKEKNLEKYKTKNYIKGIQDTLDYLQVNVPKAFVNLMTPPEVTILHELSSGYCDPLHYIVCKCGTVYGEAARNFTSARRHEYTKAIFDLVNSGRYDKTNDFTVVVQPFMEETDIPKLPNGTPDRSFFAPDCFHFSGKAHAAAALALWNGMLEPVGKKTLSWHDHEGFICPSDKNPYFKTSKNSKDGYTPDSSTTDETSDLERIHDSRHERSEMFFQHFQFMVQVGFLLLITCFLIIIILLLVCKSKSKKEIVKEIPIELEKKGDAKLAYDQFVDIKL